MPIARLLFITVDPGRVPEAIDTWKRECAGLMIRSPGCLREELMLATDDPGELISYSEWRDLDSIEQYRGSDAHQLIKEQTRGFGEDAHVSEKLYEVAG